MLGLNVKPVLLSIFIFMQTPINYYKAQVSKFESHLEALKKQLLTLSITRFLIFLVAVAFMVLLVKGNTIFGILGAVLFGVFIFLVLKHQNLQREKKIAEAKLQLNQTELKVLNKDFKDLDPGKEFLNPKHFFSHDIDLFGIGSFFQYSNRTATKAGEKLFANTLTSRHVSLNTLG